MELDGVDSVVLSAINNYVWNQGLFIITILLYIPALLLLRRYNARLLIRWLVYISLTSIWIVLLIYAGNIEKPIMYIAHHTTLISLIATIVLCMICSYEAIRSFVYIRHFF